MERRILEIFADYHQFYLWDAASPPLAPTDWNDKDVANRVKVEHGIVVVCPARNMTVPVTIEIHESEPGLDESDWDHIAEASLDIPSGELEVHECTGGSVAKMLVVQGTHRVRILMGRLDELSDDGLDGRDHYTIQIWPGSLRPLRMVKLHEP